LLWILLILLFFVVWQFLSQARNEERRLSFSQFVQDVEQHPEKFKPTAPIQIRKNQDSAEFKGTYATGETFSTTGIVGDKMLEKLDKAKLNYEVVKDSENNFWQQVFVTWLPMLVLVVLFLVFMRQLQVGGGKAMSFGKSKAKLLSENQRKITFADVAGIEEAKDEVEEIIAFLKDPKKFTRLGGRIPKGVLMMGPPGHGQDAARARHRGRGGRAVLLDLGLGLRRDVRGRRREPRARPLRAGQEERPLHHLHRRDRRRGAPPRRGPRRRSRRARADAQPAPRRDGRLRVERRRHPHRGDEPPRRARPGAAAARAASTAASSCRGPTSRAASASSRSTRRRRRSTRPSSSTRSRAARPGFSGADLENLVNEAALLAARNDKTQLEMYDFEMAKDKVLMGPERRSMIISEGDKRVTAYHEAGHALVGKMVKHADPVHKVTIIPRGRALGLTQQLPVEDRLNISKGRRQRSDRGRHGRARRRGAHLRAAHDGRLERHPAGHGHRAQDGLRLGHVREDRAPALRQARGRDLPRRDFADGTKDYSEQTAVDIDGEVKKIVTNNYDRARKIVVDNLDKLKALAEALLEYETVDGADIDVIFEGKRLARQPPLSSVSARAAAASAAAKAT
jgi:cell division protease FtsH